MYFVSTLHLLIFDVTIKHIFHTCYVFLCYFFPQTLYASAPALQAIVAPGVKTFANHSSHWSLPLPVSDAIK